MKKKGKIFCGTEDGLKNTGDAFLVLYVENNTHPKDQIDKIEKEFNHFLKSSYEEINLYSNSPYVIESFNQKCEEEKIFLGWYLNAKKSNAHDVFDSLSKPFEKLIFKD